MHNCQMIPSHTNLNTDLHFGPSIVSDYFPISITNKFRKICRFIYSDYRRLNSQTNRPSGDKFRLFPESLNWFNEKKTFSRPGDIF